MCSWVYYLTNWSIRPNPEGQIIIKPEGRIFDEMDELLKNWKAEFDHKAEFDLNFFTFFVIYWVDISLCYIK